MLVLSRKKHESIRIGENITLTVVRIAGDKVRLGFEAPKEVRVMRSELSAANSLSTKDTKDTKEKRGGVK